MKKINSQIGLIVFMVLVLTLVPFLGSCSNKSTPSPTPASSPTSASPTATTPTTSAVPGTSTVPKTSAAPAITSSAAAKAVTIKIGIMGGQTGPAAQSVVQQLKELEYILKYTNEVEGGIDGIKLDWRIVDNKGTPDGAIAAYKELKEGYKPQLYYVVEDYYYLPIKSTINEDKAVVFTSGTTDPRCFNPPDRFFSIQIANADGFAGYVKWVTENWKGPGKPKIGVLYWNLASGQGYKAAESWVLKQGVELIPVEYPMPPTDLKPQLMRLRDAGATSIWMLTLSPFAATAIRDMNALGLTDKIPMTFNEYVESAVLLSMAGKAAAGYTIIRTESPASEKSAGSQLYSKIFQWAEKKDVWSDNRLMINLKAAITAAVKQATKDVGPDKIDSVALYNALLKSTNIDTWGNSGTFGYAPDQRIAAHQMKIVKLTETGTESASDWITMPRTFEGIDK